jgi:hypothetical protein
MISIVWVGLLIFSDTQAFDLLIKFDPVFARTMAERTIVICKVIHNFFSHSSLFIGPLCK